jgi:hypothetical protein
MLFVAPALFALVVTYKFLDGLLNPLYLLDKLPTGPFTVLFRFAVLDRAFTPGREGMPTSHSLSAPFNGAPAQEGQKQG